MHTLLTLSAGWRYNGLGQGRDFSLPALVSFCDLLGQDQNRSGQIQDRSDEIDSAFDVGLLAAALLFPAQCLVPPF